MISDACWQQRFGRDPTTVGREVRIDQHRFTIVGITPPGFFGVAAGLDPELTIPLAALHRLNAAPEQLERALAGLLGDGLAELHQGGFRLPG